MSDEKPLVSVISLVYNSGINCIRSYESLLKQTYNHYEHIIIDDGSSDDSVEVVQRWIDEHEHACQFIVHKKNQGICKSLNHGLSLANGSYWAGLSDDIWMPDHLEDLVSLTCRFSTDEIGMFCGAVEVVDSDLKHMSLWESDKVLMDHGCPEDQVYELFPPEESEIRLKGNILYNYLFYANLINVVSALYSMKATKSIGFFDETLEIEDWDFEFRMAKEYDVVYTRNVTSQYVRHANSFVSNRQHQLILGIWHTFQKHHAVDTGFKRVRHEYMLKILGRLVYAYRLDRDLRNYLKSSYQLAELSGRRGLLLMKMPVLLAKWFLG